MGMEMGADPSLAMAMKIFYDQFMNVVSMARNIYGEWDRDTLDLLSDLDENKRYQHVINLRKAHIKLYLDILGTKEEISLNEGLIEELSTSDFATEAEVWTAANQYNRDWLVYQNGLLVQVKSSYALFRSVDIFKAFEGKRKKGGFLGTDNDNAEKMIAQIKAAGKKEGEQINQLEKDIQDGKITSPDDVDKKGKGS